MLERICQWIYLLAFALASHGAGAAEGVAVPSASNPADYKIKHWTTEDGLPQNRIACMQQTRDGYLWLGTWFGLARFDGMRFTVFNRQNTAALTNDTISALAEDTDGNLWIGTHDGLVKYSAGKYTRFTTLDGLPANSIWRLAASRSGGIWLEAGDKIVRCNNDQFSMAWKCPHDDTVRALQEDAEGRLNIFLDHQWLALLPGNAMTQTNLAEIDSGECLLNAGLTDSSIALAGTAEGLRRVESQTTNVTFLGGLQGCPAEFLLHDRAGNVWAQSHTNGLLRFDGTSWHAVDLDDTDNGIVCAAQDAQGNPWFGTVHGLVQLRFQKVRTFTTRDGLPNDNVWSVCEGADGNIWAGTDRGLAMIHGNRASPFKVPGLDPPKPIRCVWPSDDGGIWLARQNGGVFKLLKGEIQERLTAEWSGIPNALYEDKLNRLWVGTSGQVYCFQNGQLQTAPPGVESLRDIHLIYEDRGGDFWFGLKGGGLARLRGGKLSVLTPHDGLPGGNVWAIHEDSDGALWLGTENGLVRMAALQKDNFFQFTAQQEMPTDTVNCILEDAVGCLWFSTLHGIYRVARTELNAVAAGKAMTVHPFILGTPDGMKTPESNGETQPAGWKTRDGRIWFPTGQGVVAIDPKLFLENESAPRVVLESFSADGQKLPNGNAGRISIAAGHGHALEFDFTSCDLAAPEAVRFETRLIGASPAWSELTANREVDYFNLRPGDYRFEVKAADHHGIWSAKPAVLEFAIAPYFWQTLWFYILCAAGGIALAGSVQAYRLHWQHRLLKLEQQRALASERARIARDLHDDLGTALTGMALELDVLGREAQASSPLVERLAKASQHTRHLAERMREVVWVVNPRCDNLRSLADFLDDQAALLLRAAGLKVRMEFPFEIPEQPVDANIRHQLALSVREAFSNLVRHARASEANVRLELTDRLLSVVIRDNGCGFEPQAYLDKEHGMINMRVRMEEIGGSFQCVSAPGNGTTITFTVPLSKIKSMTQKP